MSDDTLAISRAEGPAHGRSHAVTRRRRPIRSEDAAFAREAPTARRPPRQMATHRTVRTVWGSNYIQNRDPVARKAGVNLQDYRELLSDAQCGGAVESRKAATLLKKWYLNMEGVAGGDGPGTLAGATKARFDKLGIKKAIATMLNGPLYGVQDLEVIWDDPAETGGSRYILPQEIADPPPWWFTFDAEGRRRLLTHDSGLEGVLLDDYPRKFLLVQHNAAMDAPYGEPVLARCYWPIYFKKAAVLLLSEALDRWGLPWIEMAFPHQRYSVEEQGEHIAAARAMIGGGVIGFDQEIAMKILTSSASQNGYDMFIGTIALSNAEVAKAILGHTGGIDATPGKLGGDNTALDVRKDIAQADQELVIEQMNTIIDWIYEINDPAATVRPRFAFYEETEINADVAARDAILYAQGWRPTKEYIAATYNMDPNQFELMVATAPTTGTVAADASTDAPAPASFAKPAVAAIDSTVSDTDIAELLTEEDIAAFEESIAGPLMAAIEATDTEEEAFAVLAKAYPEITGDAFREQLTRRLFAERLKGELSNG